MNGSYLGPRIKNNEIKNKLNHLKGKYQRYTCSNNSKIETLGYTKNRLTLEEGIKSTFYEQKNLH